MPSETSHPGARPELPGPPAPSPRRPFTPEVERVRLTLLESGARYAQLFHGNSAGVFFGTLGGQLLEANEALARMFGYASPAEMEGMDFADLYWDLADRPRILDRIIGVERIDDFEFRFRRIDGSLGWAIVAGGLLDQVDGVRFVQGTMLDISERKLGEARLAVAAQERRELLARVYSAEEEERRRIASELHDDSLQLLAATQMHLQATLARTSDAQAAAGVDLAL
jgi:PAS domain S-box-containing protein